MSGVLSGDRYSIVIPQSQADFFLKIDQFKQDLDCLILEQNDELEPLVKWLHGHATVLPVVIVSPALMPPVTKFEDDPLRAPLPSFVYHNAEVHIDAAPSDQAPATLEHTLEPAIEQAIAQFLKLSPACRIGLPEAIADPTHVLSTQNFLLLQQQRLTDKLKERLGYLGVYYKRHPQNFFRNLPPPERQALLDTLKTEYREIVLLYFANDDALNQRIDDFVNTLFFADIAVSQLVETHMELMDEFAKQLQLEGRSEEILLDYRLTLIDAIAHLCEMYRRSIPRDA